MEMIENKKLEALLNEVFSLEIQKGHLKWKVSDLARNCDVSKSLVYYHLGSGKEAILNSCLEIVASEFYGLDARREKMVREGNLYDSLKYTRNMFLKTPAFTIFYLRWRLTSTELGKKLKSLDQRYQARLAQLFPHLSAEQRQAVHALFYGLVTMPEMSEQALRLALNWLPLGGKA